MHIVRFLWLIPLLIYLIFSFYQIDLPGLHYDEAFEAVPALQLLQNQPVTTFRNHGLIIAGQTFPLMTQDYIGAINTYLSIPFIALLGATPAALRTMTIILGGITLWLAYLVTIRLTAKYWPGLVAATILAVDPTFIFWNRQGIFVTSVTATIGLAATLCWLLYFQQKTTRWAVAGAFLLGLGLYAKFLFLWFIVGLVGAVIVLNLPHLIKVLRGRAQFQWPYPTLKNNILIGVAFLLGCLPLIIYNVQTNGTYLNITENAGTSYYGVDNLAFGSNLLTRLYQLGVMINGSHLWYLGNIWSSPLPLLIFVFLLGLVVIMTTRNIISESNTTTISSGKIALFPFVLIALVILGSIGTVSALWVTHFALLMPWPAIAIVLAGWYLLQSQQRLLIVGSVVVLLLLVSNNLLNTIRYHQSLNQSGGLSTHSDAIYDLSDWLNNHTDGPVAAMDWGLAASISYLTAGQVNPVEVFGYAWESNQDLTARLESLIHQPETRYLWRAPDEVIFDRSSEFKALYQPLNLQETIDEAFYERSGRPLLGITHLVPAGTAENPPQ